MEPRSAPAGSPAGESSAPPQQRWRLVLARSADAPRLAGRELSEAWETAIDATGLPLHRASGRSRARVAFGAPLQLGIEAERELADILLTERVPLWRVREALEGHLPSGWRLVDLHDVWAGGPPLAGRVVGADYRIELATSVDPAAIEAAVRTLLDAAELPRVRSRGDASVAYDLRPLLVDVAIAASGPPAVLRLRTRIHPEFGTGRPEEVVAALGDLLGRPLPVRAIVRERLILADDPA